MSARACAGGCGLAAEPGDVFCAGCRDGHERDRLSAHDGHEHYSVDGGSECLPCLLDERP